MQWDVWERNFLTGGMLLMLLQADSLCHRCCLSSTSLYFRVEKAGGEHWWWRQGLLFCQGASFFSDLTFPFKIPNGFYTQKRKRKTSPIFFFYLHSFSLSSPSTFVLHHISYSFTVSSPQGCFDTD